MAVLNRKLTKTVRSIKKRLLLVAFAIAIIFVLLSIHLFLLVTNKNDEYNKIVLSQRQVSYETTTVQAKRGDILDSKGRVLATSVKVYNLILDPRVMYSGKNNRYVTPTVDALSNVYGYNRQEIYELLERKKDSAYVKYKKRLSYDEKIKFEDYAAKMNRDYRNKGLNDRIEGVWFEDEYMRVYPLKSFASNVIGFTNEDNTNGTMGIERYYNDVLSGVNGRRYGYLNDRYDLEKVIRNEVDGDNVVTTIDYNIQTIVENNIQKWQTNDVGSKDISVIVMDPNNAEILAMASSNSFDLNNPRDLYMYTTEELYELGADEMLKKHNSTHEEKIEIEMLKQIYNYDDLVDLGKEQAYFKNWKNNCIQNTYEPGSTSKIFTVASALDENIVNEETVFLCEGKIEFFDGDHTWTIKCNNRMGHGELSLEDAITVSCNMSMASIAESLGMDRFTKYQEIFGFGQKTGVDLSFEADTSKLVYTKDNMGRTALATNAFGQNYNCTMIQMAAAYASVINGGNYYKPHIMKRIENSKGGVVDEYENISIRKTASDRTIRFLKNALYQTVEVGTGKAAHINNIMVGGKTGTAEKLPRAAKNYLVSFCGFAPVESPKYLIYVVIDEPKLKGEEQARAVFATNIFRNILKDILEENAADLENEKYQSLALQEGIQVATVGNAINLTKKQEKNISLYKGKISDETIVKDKSTDDTSNLPEILP